ncbi:MAG: extracellular solute-binding protein [Planctomycetes bacterium]|nr:extracellular solute-binding protein [Planctomycetota bacterium]
MLRPAQTFAAIFIGLSLFIASCSKSEVVIYCSADQEHAEPLLKEIGTRLGLDVRPVFDIEAAKTVGLVRTLLEEKSRPRCDVFWNNEIVHTLRLKKAGVLAPYRSPSAAAIPSEWKDAGGCWTGFAARARVLIVNTQLVPKEEMPRSLQDLIHPKWKGKVGIARPLAGTTLSHFSALFEIWGEERMRAFCEGLIANGVSLESGNGPVARLVADGKLAWGLTDTDDVESQRLNGKPVQVVFPDSDGEGTLVLPNSIALIAGGPNPENGKKLIDALLDAAVEERLAASASANLPVRPALRGPKGFPPLGNIHRMFVQYEDVAAKLDARQDELKKLFLR